MTSIPLKTSDISVIIPTLNEEARIDPLADMLAGAVGETILVDGGSRDDTVRYANQRGFTVLNSTPGRAQQMNAGARQAKGSILLFLHADTVLPKRFAELIVQTLTNPVTIICAFSLEVDGQAGLLAAVIRAANLRSRLLGLPYGDQALSLRTESFNHLGGYPDLPIMEDYELVRKASRAGTVVTLPERVITSGRRWRRLGVARTTLINQAVVAGFKLGVSPDRLARWYRTGLLRPGG